MTLENSVPHIVICMCEVIPLGGIIFGTLVEVSYALADSNTYIKCSNPMKWRSGTRARLFPRRVG